ncbi:MAG: sulfite exporter TauE/SafE family protein [Acidimicrobiales bacterium]
MIVPLLLVAVLAGASLQAATGFGFGLLAAPILFAVIDPQPAIGLLAVLGPEINLLTLLTEGRRPQPLGREVLVLVGFAGPGALIGVVVLRSLDEVWLQVMLSAGVVVTLVIRHVLTSDTTSRTVLPDGPRSRPTWSAPLTGVLAGALSTSTSTPGPPLLLHLLGRGARPSVVRDTLTACFLALGLVTPIALLVTRTTEAIPDAALTATLIPAAAIGHILGRRVFARLAHGPHYELVVTIVLLVSVATGLLTVLS